MDVRVKKEEQINRLIDLLRDRKPVDLSKDPNIKWITNEKRK